MAENTGEQQVSPDQDLGKENSISTQPSKKPSVFPPRVSALRYHAVPEDGTFWRQYYEDYDREIREDPTFVYAAYFHYKCCFQHISEAQLWSFSLAIIAQDEEETDVKTIVEVIQDPPLCLLVAVINSIVQNFLILPSIFHSAVRTIANQGVRHAKMTPPALHKDNKQHTLNVPLNAATAVIDVMRAGLVRKDITYRFQTCEGPRVFDFDQFMACADWLVQQSLLLIEARDAKKNISANDEDQAEDGVASASKKKKKNKKRNKKKAKNQALADVANEDVDRVTVDAGPSSTSDNHQKLEDNQKLSSIESNEALHGRQDEVAGPSSSTESKKDKPVESKQTPKDIVGERAHKALLALKAMKLTSSAEQEDKQTVSRDSKGKGKGKGKAKAAVQKPPGLEPELVMKYFLDLKQLTKMRNVSKKLQAQAESYLGKPGFDSSCRNFNRICQQINQSKQRIHDFLLERGLVEAHDSGDVDEAVLVSLGFTPSVPKKKTSSLAPIFPRSRKSADEAISAALQHEHPEEIMVRLQFRIYMTMLKKMYGLETMQAFRVSLPNPLDEAAMQAVLGTAALHGDFLDEELVFDATLEVETEMLDLVYGPAKDAPK